MSTPREQIDRLQTFWNAVGRKLRAPAHIARNLLVAWLDHDLRNYIARKNQGFVGRTSLRLLLTFGSLVMAFLLYWLGPLLGLLLCIFWLYMDLPSIWSEASPREGSEP